MSIARWKAEYELASGFRFVESLDVPHELAYVEKHKVFARRAGRGRARELYDDKNQQKACPLVYSPDGKTIFHAHEQLVAIDRRSGQSRALTHFANGFSIHWSLFVSPDGKTVFFTYDEQSRGPERWGPTSIRAVDVKGKRVRTVYSPEQGNLWRFSCDFARSEIVASLTGPGGPHFVAMTLDGQNVHAVPRPPPLGTPSPLSDRVEIDDALAVYVPRANRSVKDAEARGTCGALSHDASAIAFVYNEHEIWDHRFGSRRSRRLVAARRGGDVDDRGSSYATAPIWSPDDRLLWFRSTSSKRSRTPDAALIAHLEEMFATDRRSLQANIEFARWDFQHRVGIIDFETKSVWMDDAHWSDVGWAPVRRRRSRSRS